MEVLYYPACPTESGMGVHLLAVVSCLLSIRLVYRVVGVISLEISPGFYIHMFWLPS